MIIGDSQTYGNNAVIWGNWPHLLRQYVPPGTKIYSTATRGWGAIQYYYAFTKSFIFCPRIIVVAFYTGNDPAETFTMAEASDAWRSFVPDGVDLSGYKLPDIIFPPPKSDQWEVKFPDGTRTTFRSKLRELSKMSPPHRHCLQNNAEHRRRNGQGCNQA